MSALRHESMDATLSAGLGRSGGCRRTEAEPHGASASDRGIAGPRGGRVTGLDSVRHGGGRGQWRRGDDALLGGWRRHAAHAPARGRGAEEPAVHVGGRRHTVEAHGPAMHVRTEIPIRPEAQGNRSPQLFVVRPEPTATRTAKPLTSADVAKRATDWPWCPPTFAEILIKSWRGLPRRTEL